MFKQRLSWFQVNYTPGGRVVRANVLTIREADEKVMAGEDVTLEIHGDVPIDEELILDAVRDHHSNPDIHVVELAPVPAAEELEDVGHRGRAAKGPDVETAPTTKKKTAEK